LRDCKLEDLQIEPFIYFKNSQTSINILKYNCALNFLFPENII
jgi:hypothetical protein